MVKYLGHDTPLGSFHNLGSWVQRRALGTSSLSILNLKTFYPQGFPVLSPENPENKSDPTSSTERLENKLQSSTVDNT
ncbi:MAG: hypothetical protein F6K11_23840, partial [Leptolyngbya sp. SIO3F4]|nr:hypothetical protein [Leptolyngbya sp. SIO3F4]